MIFDLINIYYNGLELYFDELLRGDLTNAPK